MKTPQEQHAENAALILRSRRINIVVQEDANAAADKLDPEEKHQKDVIQEMHDEYMQMKKSELQSVCDEKEIDYDDKETKAVLVDKIINKI